MRSVPVFIVFLLSASSINYVFGEENGTNNHTQENPTGVGKTQEERTGSQNKSTGEAANESTTTVESPPFQNGNETAINNVTASDATTQSNKSKSGTPNEDSKQGEDKTVVTGSSTSEATEKENSTENTNRDLGPAGEVSNATKGTVVEVVNTTQQPINSGTEGRTEGYTTLENSIGTSVTESAISEGTTKSQDNGMEENNGTTVSDLKEHAGEKDKEESTTQSEKNGAEGKEEGTTESEKKGEEGSKGTEENTTESAKKEGGGGENGERTTESNNKEEGGKDKGETTTESEKKGEEGSEGKEESTTAGEKKEGGGAENGESTTESDKKEEGGKDKGETTTESENKGEEGSEGKEESTTAGEKKEGGGAENGESTTESDKKEEGGKDKGETTTESEKKGEEGSEGKEESTTAGEKKEGGGAENGESTTESDKKEEGGKDKGETTTESEKKGEEGSKGSEGKEESTTASEKKEGGGGENGESTTESDKKGDEGSEGKGESTTESEKKEGGEGDNGESTTESEKGEGKGTTENSSSPPRDCSDWLLAGKTMSGVYKITPEGSNNSIDVFCDMKTDNGGWTVIQKRGEYPGATEDFFVKPWKDYKVGFGTPRKEYWIGNDYLNLLTNQDSYILRVDLWDENDSRAYALYSRFEVGTEDEKYLISLGAYSGTAGDALSYHNNMKFSTIDVKNDLHPSVNCAQTYHGGWWYNACLHANINGLNLKGRNKRPNEGMTWYEWRGASNSLAFTEMKIKPRGF